MDKRKELQSELQSKLEERRKSVEETEVSLQLLERRQLRQFSRADEYLYAMKEDLAEWLNMLYPYIQIDAENFMDRLETGEHLIKVRQLKRLNRIYAGLENSIFRSIISLTIVSIMDKHPIDVLFKN